MELKASGKIIEIKPVEAVKNGQYNKLVYVVQNNDGYKGAEKTLAFEIFEKSDGQRIENFQKYNSVGDFVDVTFDVESRAGTGKAEGRYFTSLKSIRADQDKDMADNTLAGGSADDTLNEDVAF